MKLRTLKLCLAASAVLALASTLTAQSNSALQDSATFDPDGTARVTRVIPMPAAISPEARKWLQSLNLESLNQKAEPPETLAERRTRTDAWRKQDSAEARTRYPVNVEEATTAGVRTDIISPLSAPENNRVLINLHGGGFNSDSGSLIEGIPIANLAKIKVVSVYYRFVDVKMFLSWRSLEPAAAVSQPPRDVSDGNGCAQSPPERQNKIGGEPEHGE
jgi:hypothetical protein